MLHQTCQMTPLKSFFATYIFHLVVQGPCPATSEDELRVRLDVDVDVVNEFSKEYVQGAMQHEH